MLYNPELLHSLILRLNTRRPIVAYQST